MEQWEYHTVMLEARMGRVASGERGVPPGNHPRNSPYALIPELNKLGEQGWELVSAHPVKAGQNHDFMITANNSREWGYHYFCVFKRRMA